MEAVAARGSAQSGDIRVSPLRPGKSGLNRVWSDYMCQLQKDGGLQVHWSKVRLMQKENCSVTERSMDLLYVASSIKA